MTKQARQPGATRAEWNQRRLARAGGYTRNPQLGVESYREPARPEFWCEPCGYALETADGFACHQEMRHRGRSAEGARA